jgi:hypothetical protein
MLWPDFVSPTYVTMCGEKKKRTKKNLRRASCLFTEILSLSRCDRYVGNDALASRTGWANGSSILKTAAEYCLLEALLGCVPLAIQISDGEDVVSLRSSKLSFVCFTQSGYSPSYQKVLTSLSVKVICETLASLFYRTTSEVKYHCDKK